MPVISFVKPRPPIDVESGANLMQALLAAGLPVASSCRGDGVCGKCRVQIVSGVLAPETSLEQRLRDRHSIPDGFRVSCQVLVESDLVVDTTYW